MPVPTGFACSVTDRPTCLNGDAEGAGQVLTQRLRARPQADDRTNFSAVWVFTPRERSLQLFKQFEVAPELGATSASGAAAFTLVEPQGGYKVGAPPLSLNPYDK